MTSDRAITAPRSSEEKREPGTIVLLPTRQGSRHDRMNLTIVHDDVIRVKGKRRSRDGIDIAFACTQEIANSRVKDFGGNRGSGIFAYN